MKLTQFTLGEDKKRVVLVQILVKLYGELTYELGCSFYFLGGRNGARVKVEDRKIKIDFQYLTRLFKNYKQNM